MNDKRRDANGNPKVDPETLRPPESISLIQKRDSARAVHTSATVIDDAQIRIAVSDLTLHKK